MQITGWLAAALLVSAPGARAQTDTGFTLSSPMYDITFSKVWRKVFDPSFLGKNGGLEGLAYVGCEPGSSLPDADSLAVFYSTILGGHITKGTAKDTTLGKYSVHRQEFNYDSLPRLDSMIFEQSGFAVKHRNGSFRVYSLVSDGYVVGVAVLSTLPSARAPYADIEAAIKTLVLHPGAGVREVARGQQKLCICDGKLSGGWLADHPALAVDIFDARGARLGEARPGADGAWVLPVLGQAAYVRVRTVDGLARVLPAR